MESARGALPGGGKLGRASVKLESGPSAGLARDFDLQPIHAMGDARSKAFAPASLRQTALQSSPQPCACAGNRPAPRQCTRGPETAAHSDPLTLNAPYLRQIDSGTDNHAVYQATSFPFAVLAPASGGTRRGLGFWERKRLQLPAQGTPAMPQAWVSQRRSCFVRLRNIGYAMHPAPIRRCETNAADTRRRTDDEHSLAMQMKAISIEEPRVWSNPLPAQSGLWRLVLSRGATIPAP